MFVFFQRIHLASVLVGLSLSCAGSSSSTAAPAAPVTEEGKTIADVAIEPSKAMLRKATTLQFHATVRYADGTTKDVTHEATWNTSDPAVATVSKEGVVTAVAVGTADITADYKGKRGHDRFVVTP